MRVYQGRTLVADRSSHAEFLKQLAAAVVSVQSEPFLLVREDDERVLVSVHERRILLSHAFEEGRTATSYGSTYFEGGVRFPGLSGEIAAANENFIDAEFAIAAVRAFFERKRMSEHTDFRYGTPEPEILAFPEPLKERTSKRADTEQIDRFVEIPSGLREDMKEVCEYLEWAENDPDENIDYDDAIQFGSLYGGRMDRRRSMYEFSYYAENDEVWRFRLPLVQLDDIADGRLLRIKVTVWATK